MEVVLGVVGLQSAARAGAAAQAGLRSGSRFAAWQRVIRGVLLSVDDAAQVARVAVAGSSGDGGVEDPREPVSATGTGSDAWGRWGGRWGNVDWISVALAAACVGLILPAPILTQHTPASVLATLAAELHPFRRGIERR